MVSPAEAVDAQLDAYNARDLERFVASYSPAIVIASSSGDVLASGHDGLRAMYGPLFDASPALSATVANRLAVGNFVADHERIEGFIHPELPPSLQAIATYEVIDGVIANVWLFF